MGVLSWFLFILWSSGRYDLGFSRSFWSLVEHGVYTSLGSWSKTTRRTQVIRQTGYWKSGRVWCASSLLGLLPVCLVSGREGNLCPCGRLGNSKFDSMGLGWVGEAEIVRGGWSLERLRQTCKVSRNWINSYFSIVEAQHLCVPHWLGASLNLLS